jgi:hypothetical protein
MTAPAPEKEYIITEEMVQCIEAWTSRYPEVSQDIARIIRSRPAPSDVLSNLEQKLWEQIEFEEDVLSRDPNCYPAALRKGTILQILDWIAELRQQQESKQSREG